MSDDKEFLEELKRDFMQEAHFLIEQCEECFLKLENSEDVEEQLSNIFRLAHSLKGGGMAVGLKDLSGFAHTVEDFLAVLRSDPGRVDIEAINLLLKAGDALKLLLANARDCIEPVPNEILSLKDLISQATLRFQGLPPAKSQTATTPGESKSTIEIVEFAGPDSSTPAKTNGSSHPPSHKSVVKVDTLKIESILDLVGEVVILKSQLLHGITSATQVTAVASLFDKTVRELQGLTLSMRMTSFKTIFLKIQRTVRDVALRLDKKVDLVLEGEQTEIDRNMVEMLGDPLMHIVRNAIDHGLETTEGRVAANKSTTGRVVVKAYQRGGRVMIEIVDDGRGIDRNKVIEKAVKSGLLKSVEEGQAMSDNEVFQILLKPGFSTAAAVSDISGRGVGLDVVKTYIEAMKGQLQISSRLNEGTTFRISLPLTTSIAEGLMVQIEDERYIFPLERIKQLCELADCQVVDVNPQVKALKIGEKVIRFVTAGDFLGSRRKQGLAQTMSEPSRGNARRGIVVIIEHDSGEVAILVDSVIGQNQVVLKPLSKNVDDNELFSGSAIMGDGKVVLVVDLDELVDAKEVTPIRQALLKVKKEYESTEHQVVNQ